MRCMSMGWTVILLVLVAQLPGCKGTPTVSDEDVQKVLYPRFLEMLEAEGKEQAILVDVRGRSSFARGHIKGALNIPVSELREEHPRLSGKQPIVVYSNGWDASALRDDMLSTVAAKKLMACGYDMDRVFDFRGGVNYWLKQGGRLTRD